MGLHISDIREFYDKGAYRAKDIEGPDKKLPENYVFDEELSVKRNREMVVEHNQKVAEIRELKRQQQNELDKKLAEDVVKYIVEYYNLTHAQAVVVERWVYREHHSFMCDYFSYIDTFAEFADDLVNLEA